MGQFNPRELKKYGIERCKEFDFSDDGNRFKGYKCPDGTRISYLYADGDYYISPRVYEKYCENFTFEEWMKNGGSDLEDEFNGCSEVIACKLVENINKAIALAKQLNKEGAKYKPDYAKLNKARKSEITKAKKRLDAIKKNLVWYNLRDYSLKEAAHYLKSVEEEIKRESVRVYEDLDIKDAKDYERRLKEYGYVAIKNDDFYLEELEAYVKESLKGEE